MNSWVETLDGTLDHIWQMLGRGTADRRAAARHPVLATMSDDGPEMRILVLRKASRSANTLTLYTDADTPKVAELTKDPRCAVHIWDGKAQIQLRFRASVAMSPGSKEVWDGMPEGAREVYGVTPAPGTPIDGAEAFTREPDYSKFLELTLHLREIDYTNLSTTPHRRAQFSHGKDGWKGQWVAP
ncbi:MAG: pyridoxamine 5'-phosphate oxidase family protein [Pseudomonadota bacterium]